MISFHSLLGGKNSRVTKYFQKSASAGCGRGPLIKHQGFLAVFSGIEDTHPAVPGPRGADEGSRWEVSTAGRDAPTGKSSGKSPAPRWGACQRLPTPNHAPRRGAHPHRQPIRWVRLVSPSFPPATFIRAAGAKSATGFIPLKTARNHIKPAPRGRNGFEWFC